MKEKFSVHNDPEGKPINDTSLYDDAFNRFDAVSIEPRKTEIIKIAYKTIPEMEQYLADNQATLKPEEKFYLQISLQAKREKLAKRSGQK